MTDAFGVSKSAEADRNWHGAAAAGNAAMGGIVGAHTLRNMGRQPKLATAVGGTWTGLSALAAAHEGRQARKAQLRLRRKP